MVIQSPFDYVIVCISIDKINILPLFSSSKILFLLLLVQRALYSALRVGGRSAQPHTEAEQRES